MTKGRADTIVLATQRLLAGELVAFPTETVYGLGADAENPQAIAKIYATKGRPSTHPIIVHVAEHADLHYWSSCVPPEAEALLKAFWPGPLTLILPKANHIPDAVSGGQDSIGIRCPSHPIAQQLLTAFAASKPNGHGGIAAPSANKFGHVSPTKAEHVVAEFPYETQAGLLVLEGGSSTIGIESTIVDVSRIGQGIGAVLLRPGHISRQQLSEVLGYEPSLPDYLAPRVSGSLKAHYAPKTPVCLVQKDELIRLLSAHDHEQPAALLAWANRPSTLPKNFTWFSIGQDPHAYARDLYALLRAIDAQAYSTIYIQALPQDPCWEAVNDRLQRAAAAFQ